MARHFAISRCTIVTLDRVFECRVYDLRGFFFDLMSETNSSKTSPL
ncbi:hypothetical protein JCM19233_3060 [Vibrio astriarenae]|nr:hypothetical protein JCM19233_3060 [Vibrio sp. C7]